jgi:hypothetical protein
MKGRVDEQAGNWEGENSFAGKALKGGNFFKKLK